MYIKQKCQNRCQEGSRNRWQIDNSNASLEAPQNHRRMGARAWMGSLSQARTILWAFGCKAHDIWLQSKRWDDLPLHHFFGHQVAMKHPSLQMGRIEQLKTWNRSLKSPKLRDPMGPMSPIPTPSKQWTNRKLMWNPMCRPQSAVHFANDWYQRISMVI